MECNFNYSMKTFHLMCESQFYEGIGRKISREQRDKIGRVCMMLFEEYMEILLVKKGS